MDFDALYHQKTGKKSVAVSHTALCGIAVSDSVCAGKDGRTSKTSDEKNSVGKGTGRGEGGN